MNKHLILIAVLCTCAVSTALAQDWDPQDSIKTVAKDQDRINNFRDNVIATTGQEGTASHLLPMVVGNVKKNLKETINTQTL